MRGRRQASVEEYHIVSRGRERPPGLIRYVNLTQGLGVGEREGFCVVVVDLVCRQRGDAHKAALAGG